MFCGKCGKEIEENAVFCPFCGEKVRRCDSETKESNENEVKEKIKSAGEYVKSAGAAISQKANEKTEAGVSFLEKHKKATLITSALVAIVSVLIIIGTIIVANKKTVINPEKYITVTYEGYDGFGMAFYEIDKDRFMKDFNRKIKWPRNIDKRLQKVMEKYNINASEEDFKYILESKYGSEEMASEFVYNLIFGNVDIGDSYTLKNGDSVTLECFSDAESDSFIYELYDFYNYDVDYFDVVGDLVKVDIKNTVFEYEVKDLTVVPTFDAFENVEILYEGAVPHAHPYLKEERKNGLIYNIWLAETVNEGDVISLTASFEDGMPENYVREYGRLPETMEKEYVVKVLPKYITTATDVSEDAMKKMKAQAEDVIRATTYTWVEGYTMTPTYIGNYFLTAKREDEETQNMLILLYKIHYSNYFTDYTGESKEYGIDYYYYVNWDNIIKNPDGSCSYDEATYWKAKDTFKVPTGVFRDYSKYSGPYNEQKLTFTGYENLDRIYNLYVTGHIENYNHEENLEVMQ